MHILKSKQIFVMLLISLWYLYGAWLPHGRAENLTIESDSQQIPVDNEKKKESLAETEILPKEKPSDKKYQTSFVKEEFSGNVKEENVHPFPHLLYTTPPIVRQLQSEEEKKGTQTVVSDAGHPQTVPDKGDTLTSVVREENDIKKELAVNQDRQPIITEKESALNNSVASVPDAQSPSLEGRETQAATINKKSSPDIPENSISSPSHPMSGTTSPEDSSPGRGGQEIAGEKEIPPVAYPAELSDTSPDKETALTKEEKGTQTLAVDNEQERNIPGEKEIASLKEEKSPIGAQPDIVNKEISQDVKENTTDSPPSGLSTSVVNEKKEEKGTQTPAVDNKQERNIPGEKEIASLKEEKSPIGAQSDIASKEISQDVKENTTDSPPSGLPVANIDKKETLPTSNIESIEKEEIKSTWDIWHTNQVLSIIIAIAITLIAAKLGGWLASIVNLPEVVGNLITGIILGNYFFFTGHEFFDFLRTMPFLKIISYFGTLLLLLTAGLHTDLRSLLRVGGSSFLVSLGGILAPAGLGLIVGYFLLSDVSFSSNLLLAIIICNTSTGLLFAILGELKVINTLEGRIITGATILTEIIVILTFGIASGIATKGEVSVMNVAVTAGIAFTFLAVVLVIILRYGESFGSFLTDKFAEGLKISVIVIVSLLFAFISGSIGLHGIIGVFAAGMLLRNVKFKDSDDKEYSNVERIIRPYYIILVPILFVRVGAQVDLRNFLNVDAVFLGLAITCAAVLGKMFCGICSPGRGINRLAIGIGMAMKLEGTLILAGIGRDMGILNDVVFSSIIMVIVFTSIVCPSLLKAAFMREKRRRCKNFLVTVDEETKEISIRFKSKVPQ